jgi:hypothetical protein
VLFSAKAWPGLRDGSITVTFRTWARAQVKVGGIYRRVPGTALQVDAVGQVAVSSITDADSTAAGEPDRAALLRRLGSPGGRSRVWRVDFHVVDAPDPRIALRADDRLDPEARASIDRRLDRLDAASSHGPWTRATLEAIAAQPGVVSTVLAEQLGRDRPSFKLDVRKLKALGLTESLEVGYRLSPRGVALLTGGGTVRPRDHEGERWKV